MLENIVDLRWGGEYLRMRGRGEMFANHYHTEITCRVKSHPVGSGCGVVEALPSSDGS